MVRPDPNYQPGDAKAVFNPETEITSNFFGGEQAADGDKHGHIDVNPHGEPTFIRDTDVRQQ